MHLKDFMRLYACLVLVLAFNSRAQARVHHSNGAVAADKENSEGDNASDKDSADPNNGSEEGSDPLVGPWGLRLGVGYGYGQSGVTYGSDVGSGGSYQASPGSGLAYQLEGLYALNQRLELGFGVFAPLAVNASASSSYTQTAGNIVTNNSSTLTFSSLPLLLDLYWKEPLFHDVTLVGGLGFGYALGGDLVNKSANSSTANGAANGSNTNNSTTSVDGTIPTHGVIGAEYKWNSNFSIFGAVAVTSAYYSVNKVVSDQTSVNSSGVTTNTTHSVTTYGPSDPARLAAPTSTFTGSIPAGSTVTSNDNGPTQSVTTRTYVAGVLTRTDTVNTSAAQKGLTVDVGQLSMNAGISYRF